MTTLMQRGKLKSSHRRSQAEMIDEQINELCEQTGLIKKRLLEVVGIYPPLWAGRIKFDKGLTQEESSKLERWIKDKGAELASFRMGDDPLRDVNTLHESFGLFKTRLLRQISTTVETLERRNRLDDDKREKLENELKKIASIFEQFSLNGQ